MQVNKYFFLEKVQCYQYIVKASYWSGLTDLKEGEWRWSYHQEVAKYKPWHNDYGSRGTSYKCGLLNGRCLWVDITCHGRYRYVCESNFCKFQYLKYQVIKN